MLNGFVVNGAAINGSAAPSGFNVSPLQPVTFGTHEAKQRYVVTSLQPVTFGRPGYFIHKAAPLQPATFGTPALRLVKRVSSLRPVRFGAASAVRSMPPPNLSVGVNPLRPVKFGVPAVSMVLGIAVGPLRSVGFGVPTMRARHHCSGLAAAVFGTPRAGLTFRAIPIMASGFGAPRVRLRFHAASMLHPVFGRPHAVVGGITGEPGSISTVQFGVPSLKGFKFHARAAMPARFGRPILNRGASC